MMLKIFEWYGWMKIGLIIVVTNILNMLNMINMVQPTWKFDGISLMKLIYVDGSSWTLMAWKRFNHQNPSKSIKIWVCLKMLCTPKKPMVFMIIIPTSDGYFIGGIPHFQTYPSMKTHCLTVSKCFKDFKPTQKFQQLLELLQKLSLQVTKARTATAQRDKRGIAGHQTAEPGQAMVPCFAKVEFKVKIWWTSKIIVKSLWNHCEIIVKSLWNHVKSTELEGPLLSLFSFQIRWWSVLEAEVMLLKIPKRWAYGLCEASNRSVVAAVHALLQLIRVCLKMLG